MAGSAKGYIGGFFSSLGDNLIPTALASLALAGKGVFAKIERRHGVNDILYQNVHAYNACGAAVRIVKRGGAARRKPPAEDVLICIGECWTVGILRLNIPAFVRIVPIFVVRYVGILVIAHENAAFRADKNRVYDAAVKGHDRFPDIDNIP